MMQEKQSIQKKRDVILVVLLFVIMGAVFLLFRAFAFQEDASLAYVYYGNSNQPIVTIDFVRYQVIRHYDQDVPDAYEEGYPIIDEDAQTITILGDYEVGGIRQIVVIRYDFDRRSVKIIEEQSPNNICSREGESTGWPLICLPNRVRVEFETNDEDFTI